MRSGCFLSTLKFEAPACAKPLRRRRAKFEVVMAIRTSGYRVGDIRVSGHQAYKFLLLICFLLIPWSPGILHPDILVP